MSVVFDFCTDFLGVSLGLYEKTDEMHMILASIFTVWNHSFWRLWGRPGTSILGGFGGPGTSILGVFSGTQTSHPFLPLFCPSWRPLGSLLGPSWGHLGAQDGPR